MNKLANFYTESQLVAVTKPQLMAVTKPQLVAVTKPLFQCVAIFETYLSLVPLEHSVNVN
jgi:hypothetical protein